LGRSESPLLARRPPQLYSPQHFDQRISRRLQLAINDAKINNHTEKTAKPVSLMLESADSTKDLNNRITQQ
jgi:hypothetical protein